MGVEQHLVRLERIGPHQKGAAMRQLRVCHLKLDPFAADVVLKARNACATPIFAPIELECLAGLEHQGDKGAASGRLLCAKPVLPPCPSKRRYTTVGSVIAELDQILMYPLTDSAFLQKMSREVASQFGAPCAACVSAPRARRIIYPHMDPACSDGLAS